MFLASALIHLEPGIDGPGKQSAAIQSNDAKLDELLKEAGRAIRAILTTARR